MSSTEKWERRPKLQHSGYQTLGLYEGVAINFICRTAAIALVCLLYISLRVLRELRRVTVRVTMYNDLFGYRHRLD